MARCVGRAQMPRTPDASIVTVGYTDVMRINRRRALKGLTATAALGSAGLGAACFPLNRSSAGLVELARQRVTTVVVLMMENRSFDHSFGALSLVEGRADVDGLRPDMANPDGAGNLIVPREADLGCIADPPHGWESSHLQWNNGNNDGFVTEYAAHAGTDGGFRVMDYLPRAKQTASWALAEEYALCHRWFASVMGPTWPNRYYLLAASAHGKQSNDFIGHSVDTLYHRLDDADVPWANYYGNIPFAITLEGMSIQDPEMRKLERFFEDAEKGELPPVVIIDPIYGRSDDHPPTHPVAGQLFIQSIYEALRTSPQWDECMFVVTYDEHGGFHDHVPPPTVPDDYADLGFDRLGFRVPAFVVGPWVKQGVVDTVFDHSSVYATLAALHDLPPLGARDAAANTLLSVLDEDRMREGAPRAGIVLDPIVADEAEIFADECKGFSFHLAQPVHRAATGQPELELALARTHPALAARLRADTDGVWRDLVERARGKGLLTLG